jgi:hypothetical protein
MDKTSWPPNATLCDLNTYIQKKIKNQHLWQELNTHTHRHKGMNNFFCLVKGGEDTRKREHREIDEDNQE